jgi:hypothetical protein
LGTADWARQCGAVPLQGDQDVMLDDSLEQYKNVFWFITVVQNVLLFDECIFALFHEP